MTILMNVLYNVFKSKFIDLDILRRAYQSMHLYFDKLFF
ncbi:hypothetical protein CSCA_0878 [Clostridium scatologenes]|uniref:Uncharacterized protein n=1 Tax=Clostridium scatologenes TaxID=1548 RepID=A0A0E3M535_CLOSL|nr:hypothetical protein CSCA_0878 [Clostridium scatologenes]